MATPPSIRWPRSIAAVVLGLTTILTVAQGAMGQVAFEVVHAFGSGRVPVTPLIQASDGSFYGTTQFQGAFFGGTVFKVTADGTLTPLHSFDCSTEGCVPLAGLIQAKDGDFYGTTAFGGTHGAGTVFKMDATGTVTTLHSFDCTTGCGSRSALIQTSDGTFYGTTNSSLVAGAGGSVFKLVAGGAFTTLHVFDCAADGCDPAGFVQASDGDFYGTTSRGGRTEGGTVFKITASGTFTKLHDFDCLPGGCTPIGGLIQASDGKFYGTTTFGGATGGASGVGDGTVFRMDATGTVAKLHSFDCSIEGSSAGCSPISLVQGRDGNFYGTTTSGGVFFNGIVFKMDGTNTVTTLHSFDCAAEGCTAAGLVQSGQGDFYGTTVLDRTGNGTVFRITDAGVYTTVRVLNCGADEGCRPIGGLIQATDGNLYGTTSAGGAAQSPDTGEQGGTVFRLTAANKLTTLHAFDCHTEGCGPEAGLIQAKDGNFYGTTVDGGALLTGTAFKLTAAGSLTTLHSFDCGERCWPPIVVTQASDGNFYGTTTGGGTFGNGTVFKMDATGTVTMLHSFDCSTEGSTDGCNPTGGVIQASDGNLYGVTSFGGAGFSGTFFKVTAAGAYATLHSFDGNTEGGSPWAGLIQASDGNFYGTTRYGGAFGNGTVFKITAAGSYTTVHSFDCSTEGCIPYAGVIQASDGNLYGTTVLGGTAGVGTIFKLTTTGAFTTLHSFDCNTGCSVAGEGGFAGLIQASDGTFYGTTRSGGPGGEGVVFRLVTNLSLLSPARVWIGLKNSDDVGLRLDLLAEAFVDGTKVGEGRRDNVSAGSSGFNNALLNTIVLERVGEPMSVPAGSTVAVKISARRTCAGGGHNSGTVRLWYNGRPIDSGAQRDAGTRLAVFSGGATTSDLLRSGFALSTIPGTSRQSVDVIVDSKQSCPNRAFTSFGTWSTNR